MQLYHYILERVMLHLWTCKTSNFILENAFPDLNLSRKVTIE